MLHEVFDNAQKTVTSCDDAVARVPNTNPLDIAVARPNLQVHIHSTSSKSSTLRQKGKLALHVRVLTCVS